MNEAGSEWGTKVHRIFATCLSLLLLLISATGCGLFPPVDSGPKGTVSLANDIQPIFTSRCSGCHRDGSSTSNGGIAIRLVEGRSRATLVNQASALDPLWIQVIPGDATNSLLIQKLTSDTPPVGQRMPRNSSPLEQAQIDLIATWINEGALDN